VAGCGTWLGIPKTEDLCLEYLGLIKGDGKESRRGERLVDYSSTVLRGRFNLLCTLIRTINNSQLVTIVRAGTEYISAKTAQIRQ
jgi:hypothetical protein